MDKDGIPLQSDGHIVIPDAADIAETLQVIPVDQDSHLTAHIALLQDLVEHLRPVDAVLRLGFLIDGIHHRQRTPVVLLLRHPLMGEAGPHQAFRRRNILLLLRDRLRLILNINHRGRGLRGCLRGRSLLRRLSAAGNKRQRSNEKCCPCGFPEFHTLPHTVTPGFPLCFPSDGSSATDLSIYEENVFHK